MSDKQIIDNAAFDPATTAILTSAFDEAWRTVQKSGSDLSEKYADETRTIIAKHIITTAMLGERNPRELVDSAINHLALVNLATFAKKYGGINVSSGSAF